MQFQQQTAPHELDSLRTEEDKAAQSVNLNQMNSGMSGIIVPNQGTSTGYTVISPEQNQLMLSSTAASDSLMQQTLALQPGLMIGDDGIVSTENIVVTEVDGGGTGIMLVNANGHAVKLEQTIDPATGTAHGADPLTMPLAGKSRQTIL